MQEKKKIYYGWWVAAVCFLVMFFTVGATTTAFSATSAYVVQEWGISQTEVSSLITVRTTVCVIAMYLCGLYYKKISLRVGLTLGVAMGAAGYAVFALSSGMTGALIAMVIIGACSGFGGMYAISLLAEHWFFKKKGLVLGVVTTASGFTSMILPKMITSIVESASLAMSFWVTAAMFAVVALAVALFVRDFPSDMGLVRYGEGEEGDKSKRTVTERYAPSTKHCVYMMIACFIIGAICYVQGQIRTLNLTTVGWSAADAAAALAPYGAFIIIGKLIYGPISDRWSQRKIGWIFFMLVGISHAIFALAPYDFFNYTLVIINVILYSLGGPICTIGLALYGIELAKDGDTVKWIRNYLVVYNIAPIVLTPLAGMSADATGNYSLCFWILAALSVVGAVFAQLAYSGAYKRYNKLHGGQNAAEAEQA